VHRSSPKTQSKQKIHIGYVIALLVIGAMVGYGISIIGSKNQGVGLTSTFDGNDASLSATIFDIAKEFNCPCGKCEHSLEICSCDHPNGAAEIKNFMTQQLYKTHKKPHIIEMVQAKYGGLKEPTKQPLKFDFPSN
jgi:hypothetical protein